MARRRNILIYRLGSLGDTVVALPCFHLIARAYPDCNRVLLTNAPVHTKAPAAWSVLGDSGLIHEYVSYPVGTRNIFELGRIYRKLREFKADTLIYLTPPRGSASMRRDEIFFRFCGVAEIIGIPQGDLGRHKYDSSTGRYEAESSRLARCLAPIGDAQLGDPQSWNLVLTAEEEARADLALQRLEGAPFLSLGIASKKQVTDWGEDNWAALMPKLRRSFPNHALVFVGAREDRAAIHSVAARWQGISLDLSGELSPRESAGVIRRSDIFLGPDSGPMHLAESVGTPCVSIFAAHKLPGMWFPYGDAHEVIYHKTDCFGCGLEVCHVEKKKCITSITVEEVAAATARAYERKNRNALRDDLRIMK